jgi:hypothetical protein
VGAKEPVKKKPPKRPKGRPPKNAPPTFPRDEVDSLLVHGETTKCANGESTTIRYPSHAELARRYGVCRSLISRFSREKNCDRRRKEAQVRARQQADRHMVELRAKSIVISQDETVSIIDEYLEQFLEAVKEGRVRADNPADFNTMVRLKGFIMGGPDSRSEVHAKLSLETIQERHQQMVRVSQATPEVRGELEAKRSRDPPSRRSANARQNVPGENPPAGADGAGGANPTGGDTAGDSGADDDEGDGEPVGRAA